MFRRKPKPTSEESLAQQRERVISALLAATANLSHVGDPDLIIKSICESIVNASAHIRLAWTLFGPPDADMIIPKIYAGPASGYAAALKIPKNRITARGPAFQALLNARPDYMALSRMSLFRPWRTAAVEYGFEVAAAFPLQAAEANKRGILIIYADDKDYFKNMGIDAFRALAQMASASLNQAALRRQLQAQAETDRLTGLCSRQLMGRDIARLRGLAGRRGAAHR